jgi:hypothetical protein
MRIRPCCLFALRNTRSIQALTPSPAGRLAASCYPKPDRHQQKNQTKAKAVASKDGDPVGVGCYATLTDLPALFAGSKDGVGFEELVHPMRYT